MTSVLARRAYALRRLWSTSFFRLAQSRSCVTRTTGEGANTDIGPWKPQDVSDPFALLHETTEQLTNELTFPDGRDPLQNPLAPLSQDKVQQDASYWTNQRTPPKKIVYERKVNENGVAYGRGGRKRSHARVWIREGSGCVTINGDSWVDYFTRVDQRDKILRPMHLLGMTGKFDVRCMVAGGGQTGQAEAIRFSLSRALQNWHPDWRSALKKDGLLTRDSRIVEMKKFGKKKARKSFQWVKR